MKKAMSNVDWLAWRRSTTRAQRRDGEGAGPGWHREKDRIFSLPAKTPVCEGSRLVAEQEGATALSCCCSLREADEILLRRMNDELAHGEYEDALMSLLTLERLREERGT